MHLFVPYLLAWFFSENPKDFSMAGDHGYDNRIQSMRAIFTAMGPSVRINNEIPPFQNTELYNLFVGKNAY